MKLTINERTIQIDDIASDIPVFSLQQNYLGSTSQVKLPRDKTKSLFDVVKENTQSYLLTTNGGEFVARGVAKLVSADTEFVTLQLVENSGLIELLKTPSRDCLPNDDGTLTETSDWIFQDLKSIANAYNWRPQIKIGAFIKKVLEKNGYTLIDNGLFDKLRTTFFADDCKILTYKGVGSSIVNWSSYLGFTGIPRYLKYSVDTAIRISSPVTFANVAVPIIPSGSTPSMEATLYNSNVNPNSVSRTDLTRLKKIIANIGIKIPTSKYGNYVASSSNSTGSYSITGSTAITGILKSFSLGGKNPRAISGIKLSSDGGMPTGQRDLKNTGFDGSIVTSFVNGGIYVHKIWLSPSLYGVKVQVFIDGTNISFKVLEARKATTTTASASQFTGSQWERYDPFGNYPTAFTSYTTLGVSTGATNGGGDFYGAQSPVLSFDSVVFKTSGTYETNKWLHNEGLSDSDIAFLFNMRRYVRLRFYVCDNRSTLLYRNGVTDWYNLQDIYECNVVPGTANQVVDDTPNVQGIDGLIISSRVAMGNGSAKTWRLSVEGVVYDFTFKMWTGGQILISSTHGNVADPNAYGADYGGVSGIEIQVDPNYSGLVDGVQYPDYMEIKKAFIKNNYAYDSTLDLKNHEVYGSFYYIDEGTNVRLDYIKIKTPRVAFGIYGDPAVPNGVSFIEADIPVVASSGQYTPLNCPVGAIATKAKFYYEPPATEIAKDRLGVRQIQRAVVAQNVSYNSFAEIEELGVVTSNDNFFFAFYKETELMGAIESSPSLASRITAGQTTAKLEVTKVWSTSKNYAIAVSQFQNFFGNRNVTTLYEANENLPEVTFGELFVMALICANAKMKITNGNVITLSKQAVEKQSAVTLSNASVTSLENRALFGRRTTLAFDGGVSSEKGYTINLNAPSNFQNVEVYKIPARFSLSKYFQLYADTKRNNLGKEFIDGIDFAGIEKTIKTIGCSGIGTDIEVNLTKVQVEAIISSQVVYIDSRYWLVTNIGSYARKDGVVKLSLILIP